MIADILTPRMVSVRYTSMSGSPYSLRALIIEDNEDLAQLFVTLFEVIGCICDLAKNGDAGLKIAKETMPQLIFCDLYMPTKSGFEVAKEVRADRRFDTTWLIAVTASDDPTHGPKTRAAGFDRLYRKPIKFSELTELVNDYLASNP